MLINAELVHARCMLLRAAARRGGEGALAAAKWPRATSAVRHRPLITDITVLSAWVRI
jgi:hypothetical protein